MSEDCEHETIRSGYAKELKEALRRHGQESGSTDEATRLWRRAGKNLPIDRPSLDEEDE